MGWFATQEKHLFSSLIFSSPSGDGLVPGFTDEKKAKEIFSSPSGDGLVLVGGNYATLAGDFRPRVGMGWFNYGTVL